MITCSEKEKIIPDCLKAYLKLSIGNHSEELLIGMRDYISFFLTLMSDVLTFCKKTIETVPLEIKETQKELNNKLENEEREEINATLRENHEINWKHLLQRKNKKFTYLQYKPTWPITETTEFLYGLQPQRKTDNPGENKPMQASSVSEVTLTFREN